MLLRKYGVRESQSTQLLWLFTTSQSWNLVVDGVQGPDQVGDELFLSVCVCVWVCVNHFW